MDTADRKMLTQYLGSMVINEFESPDEDRDFSKTAPATLDEARFVVRTAVTEQSDLFLEILFAYLENADTLSRGERERLTDFPAEVYVNLISGLRLSDPECPGCQHTGMFPSHIGSRGCESGSISSGGTNSHCTCDTCF